MGKFVRKDIEKTPNSFFYTPKRFISKAEAFSKNVSACKLPILGHPFLDGRQQAPV